MLCVCTLFGFFLIASTALFLVRIMAERVCVCVQSTEINTLTNTHADGGKPFTFPVPACQSTEMHVQTSTLRTHDAHAAAALYISQRRRSRQMIKLPAGAADGGVGGHVVGAHCSRSPEEYHNYTHSHSKCMRQQSTINTTGRRVRAFICIHFLYLISHIVGVWGRGALLRNWMETLTRPWMAAVRSAERW